MSCGTHPPPGTFIVEEGVIKQGDWFFCPQVLMWSQVPLEQVGKPVAEAAPRLIARGKIDMTRLSEVPSAGFEQRELSFPA